MAPPIVFEPEGRGLTARVGAGAGMMPTAGNCKACPTVIDPEGRGLTAWVGTRAGVMTTAGDCKTDLRVTSGRGLFLNEGCVWALNSFNDSQADGSGSRLLVTRVSTDAANSERLDKACPSMWCTCDGGSGIEIPACMHTHTASGCKTRVCYCTTAASTQHR